jgi:hypothetical protein
MVQGALLSDSDVDRYVIIKKLRNFISNLPCETKLPYGRYHNSVQQHIFAYGVTTCSLLYVRPSLT